MLTELNIKNAALIKSANIQFNKGLNVLSGETGAGKSMVIGSLTFALGERVSRDFIRSGEEKAVVEAVFCEIDDNLKSYAEEMGIECDEDMLIFQRSINQDGKTTARINGSTVTVSALKDISKRLMDIHSQHEHHSLLNASKHIDILDKFCMPEINELKKELSIHTSLYKQVLEKLKKVSGNDEERKRKIEFLEHKINEIGMAKLKKGEEEELLNRKKILAVLEKLIKLTNQALGLLHYGSEREQSAEDKVGEALKLSLAISQNDENAAYISDIIQEADDKIKEAVSELNSYIDNIGSDPEELEKIEERLDVLYNLKKKYGQSIDDVMKVYDDALKELDFILNSEKIRNDLNKEKENVQKKIRYVCQKMTDLRKKTAEILEEKITNELKDLEMKNAQFCIKIEKKDTFNLKGWDNVEFMISTNMGESLKPLSKTASGGEMSRVMLGLKTVISSAESIGTFVFDEIDTGISGKTASKVAEKMVHISSNQQIICITHLPQIASMADKSLLIEKFVEEDKTVTNIRELGAEEKVMEVMRLMGSANTNTAFAAAEEMVSLSNSIKNKIRK